MRSRIFTTTFALVVALAAGACSESSAEDDGTPSAQVHMIARALTEVDVFSAPGGNEYALTLPASTAFGSPTTLAVVEQSDEWLHVLLPVRPNGSSGWVHESAVTLEQTSYAVDVDLAGRVLRLYESGELALETPIAIGAGDAPTPTGAFFVTDVLDTPDGGAYGPFAIGLSAHSDVFTEFAGGDGQIGIHGTNDPSSIGNAVSHGCVRAPNEVISQLAAMLPLGTPVTVR